MTWRKGQARGGAIGHAPGMRLDRLCLLGALFGVMAGSACGPQKGETTETGGSTGASSGSSSGEVTTGATGGSGGTTGGSGGTSDGSAGSSGGTSGSSATTGSETTGGGSTGGSETTGGGADACAVDGDCKLHSDCCACEGVPVGENPTDCAMECKQAKCSEYGVEKAMCRFGVCQTARLSCDGNKVLCDALPPPCPPGEVAETSPACWTGKCVPAALCDVVPECALCPDGTVCVQDVAFGPQGWPRCEPIPAACGGVATCDCVGSLVCVGEFSACNKQGEVIDCECPNC